jgi:hypothetical protein
MSITPMMGPPHAHLQKRVLAKGLSLICFALFISGMEVFEIEQ